MLTVHLDKSISIKVYIGMRGLGRRWGFGSLGSLFGCHGHENTIKTTKNPKGNSVSSQYIIKKNSKITTPNLLTGIGRNNPKTHNPSTKIPSNTTKAYARILKIINEHIDPKHTQIWTMSSKPSIPNLKLNYLKSNMHKHLTDSSHFPNSKPSTQGLKLRTSYSSSDHNWLK